MYAAGALVRLPICRLLLAALCVLCWWQSREHSRQGHTRALDDDALHDWIDHVSAFPVQAKDRYAFDEMGFRTTLYAESLQQAHTARAAALEHALFSFLPAAPRLRSSMRFETSKGGSRTPLGRQTSRRQGIVVATDAVRLRATLELVTTLRYVINTNLPIEIVHWGEANMPLLIQRAFSQVPRVATVDVARSDLFGSDGSDGFNLHNTTIHRDAALRALALLATSFDEIVYAEPGTIFYGDPQELFDEPGYARTGTLFFHGMNTVQQPDSERFLNYLRQQFDQGPPSTDLAQSPFYNFGLDHHQDGQVMALDRSRPSVFAALLFNAWMHRPEVRELIWHAHFRESLAETVWLAFELARLPYAFEPAYPGAIGTYEGPIDDLPWEPAICPAHALHFVGRADYTSRSGRPLWSNGGLKVFPHHSRYLAVNAYSARGRWRETRLGMCLHGADAHPASTYEMASIFDLHRETDETFGDVFAPLFDLYNISPL